MKKERIIMIRELLVTQMTHWLLFLLAVTVLGLVGAKEPVIWKWAVLGLVPYILFLVRRYSNHFLVFMGSHIALILLLTVISYVDLAEQIAFYVCVIGYVAYSFYLRVRTKERLTGVINPIAAVGAAGGFRLFQHYQGIPEWERYYVAPVIIFLCFYFIQMYLEQYQHFLIVNDSSTGHIPEKAMFRSGVSLVGLFSVGVSVLLLLTSDVGWVGRIANMLKNILIWVLRLLFRGGGEEVEEILPQETTTQKQNQGMMPMEEAEPALIWVILEKLVMIAMAVAFAALIIWAIYSLIKFLHDRFQGRILFDQEEPENVTDVREKCEVERRQSKKRSFFGFLSTKERIRRIYKKEVWAGRWQLAKDGSPEVLRRLTAKECGEGLSRADMAQVYEKARYSQEECTSEDIRRAKEK